MNILDVQNLTLSFGENTLFSNLSFDIGEKDKVGFVGVNGAGKTSLFKISPANILPTAAIALFLKKPLWVIWSSTPVQMIKLFGMNL